MKCEVYAEAADGVPDNSVDAEMQLEQTQTAMEITSRLTPRELDCLRLRVEGFSYGAEPTSGIDNIHTGHARAFLQVQHGVHHNFPESGSCLSACAPSWSVEQS